MHAPRSLGAVAAALMCGTAIAVAPAASAAETARPGCDGVDAQGRMTLSVESGGRDRTVLLYVPSGYDGHRRLALILDLHGSGSSAAEELSRSRLEETAEAHTFLVAAPQGAIPSGANWSWNVPHVTAAPPGAPDDEQFLDDLVAELSSSFCVDPKQVYGSGYSGGGRMVSQYACDGPGPLAGIAPVAGLRAGAPTATEGGFAPDPDTCRPDRPLPVVTFAGTADPVNPYAGGGAPYWRYGIAAAQQRWAALNGCASAPGTSQVTANVASVAYTGCDQGADVVLYTVAGGGHTWPGGNPAAFPPGLGLVTQEISANELMWAFFRDVQLSRIAVWFDELETMVDELRADDRLSMTAAAALRDRLVRARALAVSGSETRTIGYLQQFVARAVNQVKGDADDLSVRAMLVADATAIIALLQEAEEAENESP
jgi:polyhydroxybutyrate depolymerase